MIEMLFRQIFENELLDEEFCEYLEKRLDSSVVEDLQMKYDVLDRWIIVFSSNLLWNPSFDMMRDSDKIFG